MTVQTNMDRLREINRRLDELSTDEIFRAAFSFSPLGIIVAEPNGTIVRINNAACLFLGHGSSAEEKEPIKAAGWKVLTHPDDLAVDMALCLDPSIEAYRLRKRYLRKDGSPLWVTLTVRFVRNGLATEDRLGIAWFEPCDSQDYTVAEIIETWRV